MNLTNLKRLIVLEGDSNSGKTTTLNDVYNKLKTAFPQSTPLYEKTFKSGSLKDHLLVMTGKAGRLTAIHTSGDDANRVVRSFAVAEKFKCEVLVMAVTKPKRTSTLPIAEIAFDEIVQANALQPQRHQTQSLGQQSAMKQMAQQLSNAIWQQM